MKKQPIKTPQMTIDYFEFTVLVEASWHCGTILRASIIEKAINVWYNILSKNDRARAYTFFTRVLELDENPDSIAGRHQRRLLARYNPDNQYVVTATNPISGIINVDYGAYLYDGRYWVNGQTYIVEECINNVEKVGL